MSPIPMQPRRKRNLLRTFGSRHKPGDVAVAVSTNFQDTPGYGSIKDPDPKGVADRDTVRTPLAGDSSSVYSVPSPVTPAVSVKMALECGSNGTHRKILSPFQMHPVDIRAAESPTNRARSSLETKKSYWGTPASRRHTTSSLHVETTPDLLQSWEDSMTSLENTTLLDEKMQSLFRAERSAESAQDGMRRNQLPVSQSAIQTRSPGPEEINNKVWAMLEATDTLKSSPLPPTMGSSSKVNRMGHSKMFSKVSEAWNRFYSKSASPEAKEKINLGTSKSDSRLVRGNLPAISRRHRSPVSSMEIRLNETLNLDKVKVQKVVGRSIARKPVPPRESSSRNRVESMESFSAVSSSIYSQPSDSHTSKVQQGLVFSSPPHISPFESERDFEHNLPGGVLETSPTGSSTPRAHMRKVSDTTESAASIGSSGESSTAQVDMARVVATPGRCDIPGKRARQITLLPSRSQRRPATAAHPVNAPDFKKHPSPSKPLLKKYALALQLCPPNDEIRLDEVDELAANHTGAALPLGDRDPNRMVRRKKFGQSACQISALSAGTLQVQVTKECRRSKTQHSGCVGREMNKVRSRNYNDADELV